ncbi:DNA adenine methylase [Paenibacillus sp. 1_12]|uniref:DNA adenine methylase n=1 Tax=Paenibacillus sp. 1_12 TaxID=1566278 RepID=UPI001C48BEDB|nr:DNA adenine methylase [Paenibacillus sp. 1_12]
MSSTFIYGGNKVRHLLTFPPHKKAISWADMNRLIQSVIPYPGGKAGLVSRIVPLLEWVARQYNLLGYIEATGGACRCLLNIDPTLFKHRIYSDVDYPLVCLWHVLGNEELTEKLIRKLSRQNYSEEVFNKALVIRKRDNELARQGRFRETSEYVNAAADTFVVACQSYAGGMKSYARSVVIEKRKLYFERVLGLSQFTRILSGVEVMRKDCRKLIEEFKTREDYLIYCDPPYDPKAMKGNKHYEFSWNREDHINFRDLIKDTDSYMVISGYASDIYDELENNGWQKVFLKNKHIGMSGSSDREAEYIYINFEISDELRAIISSREEPTFRR